MKRNAQRVVRVALPALVVLSFTLTGVGLLIAVAMKNSTLAEIALNLYPRYALAMKGLRTLQDFKYPNKEGDKVTNLAVLTIDEPAWPVMRNFIESETAILKSERNEPDPPVTPSPASESAQMTGPSARPLPRINFDRIKTIIAVRVDVVTAGTKPLAPPYRLVVLWPENVGRRVYEFLSFEEFRVDLRRTLIDSVEEISLWLSVIAFAIGAVAAVARRLVGVEVRTSNV